MILKQILTLIGDNYPKSQPLDGGCACCGGDLSEGGTEFKKLFTASSFNLNHSFADMASKHVCSACAVFFSRANWEAYCERSGKDPHFPRVEGKKPSLANWVFFSHYFAEGEHKIVTSRQDWRTYLLDPPKPPFCYVISTICKKHLIFKAEMAYDREEYPVRFEEHIIYVNRELFTKCLTSFEKLYSEGLSKATIKTGDYNSSALLKADKAVVAEHEPVIAGFRLTHPAYLELCEFIGAKDAG